MFFSEFDLFVNDVIATGLSLYGSYIVVILQNDELCLVSKLDFKTCYFWYITLDVYYVDLECDNILYFILLILNHSHTH